MENENQKPLPPPPCGACGHRGTTCGPHCVFAPFFPPHREADFASVRSLYSLERITLVLTTLQPEIGEATIQFMIRESKARAHNAVPSRLHHLINAALLLTDLLVLMPELQLVAANLDQLHPEPPPSQNQDLPDHQGRGFGDPQDLVTRRRDPAEVAERSVQVGPSSSAANIKLSAPTVFDGD